ncbi:NAD(P)-dependent oxidoreductase [Ramlibacter sp. WS9]|uniref:NAD(P)-dependent oxidoreductase n=1 Tax=Ramlibacter sp. WS9 TaxID=1882741 RepID=UPI001141C0EB|nr:NAD(P)-dependent oxidoreductase [Ramlibacter sp. WS9]ROZ72686.1 NAD(P)-dependent oxidoreductase [Ramlibacter sp. WS9]
MSDAGPPQGANAPLGGSAAALAASVGATYGVAIAGVGNMGGAMAQRLLDQRWPVHVFDVDPAKMEALQKLGAIPRDNPAHAVVGCGVLIVCVVDAAQTEEVLFGANGAAAAMGAGQTVMLCPTIAPGDVEHFAQRLAEAGISTIDAPMSGGPARARDGSMSLMVACEDDVFERRRLLIEVLSNKVFRISRRPGDGARTKLVNNLLAGINLAGAAEALAMAQRMGLDPAATLDVIEQSSGQSWIGSDRMRRAIAGDYEPRAHVTLLQKDTRLAVQAAQAAGFEGPLGGAAHDVFARAAQAGLGPLDDAALFKLLSGT